MTEPFLSIRFALLIDSRKDRISMVDTSCSFILAVDLQLKLNSD